MAAHEKPREMSCLGDGCYHVFLDIGSNRGVHSRFLFEPTKYPGNGVSDIFDEAFGRDRNLTSICVFAFEPNPRHVERQQAIQMAYRRMGWRYTFINAAVGDADGTLKFYANSKNASRDRVQWGFSSSNLNPRDQSNVALAVPVIDLVSWSKRHILSRTVPANESQRPPAIVAKIDIEGMELPLLTQMVAAGVACQMRTVFLELHGRPVKLRNRVMLWNHTAQEGYFATLNQVLSAAGCGLFVRHDSEAYGDESKPLPQPL